MLRPYKGKTKRDNKRNDKDEKLNRGAAHQNDVPSNAQNSVQNRLEQCSEQRFDGFLDNVVGAM